MFVLSLEITKMLGVQGTYPRTEPTVGQAHRIYFHAQNSAQRFHWMFWHSWSASRGRNCYFRQLILRLKIAVSPPCPKSANITLSHTSSLYTQFHIENARPKVHVGNDFADAWLNSFLARVIWNNNWEKPVGVLQVLFQEYKNVEVLLWNPMKFCYFSRFICVKFKTSRASVRG